MLRTVKFKESIGLKNHIKGYLLRLVTFEFSFTLNFPFKDTSFELVLQYLSYQWKLL